MGESVAERGPSEQAGLRVTWMSFIDQGKDRGAGGRTRDRGGEGDRDEEEEKQGQAKMKAGKAPVGVVSHVVTGFTCVKMTP